MKCYLFTALELCVFVISKVSSSLRAPMWISSTDSACVDIAIIFIAQICLQTCKSGMYQKCQKL